MSPHDHKSLLPNNWWGHAMAMKTKWSNNIRKNQTCTDFGSEWNNNIGMQQQYNNSILKYCIRCTQYIVHGWDMYTKILVPPTNFHNSRKMTLPEHSSPMCMVYEIVANE